jgi:hypothetical protein
MCQVGDASVSDRVYSRELKIHDYMMDHDCHQSKEQSADQAAGEEKNVDSGSYYYDDSTNYEVFRDDESEVSDDDDQSE